MEKYLNKFYNFIDKIGKPNFILIIFIFIVLITTSLYQTFSLYTESEGLSILNGMDTYSFILDASNENKSVTMAPGTSKNIDITVRNESDSALKYYLYSLEESNPDTNLIFGYSTITEHLPSGIISPNTNYIVTLKVYNYTASNQTINFGVKYGFENNEELTLSSEQHSIEPLYIMKKLFNLDTDTTYFASYRSNITNVNFVDLDKYVEESGTNVIETWNVSAASDDDDSVKAWITGDNSGKYKLYIGAKDKIYVEDLQSFFANMTSLTKITFANLDTSLTKGMERLFKGCTSLTTIGIAGISSFDTSNVTSILGMFFDCSGLESLDLSNFNTSNVINMRNMFTSCSSLTELNFSDNFDTSKVTNMYSMFCGCRNLTSLDLSNFDTSKVSNMSYMFEACHGLTSLDLSNFNTSKVTNMSYMFNNCSSLTNLDLSSFDTSKVTDFTSMFRNCAKLTDLRVTIKNNSSITPSYSNMFYNAATGSGASIIVYYTTDTRTLVENMVATKSSNSNVISSLVPNL